MSQSDSIWYRLGHAFETRRHEAPSVLRGLAERGLRGSRGAGAAGPEGGGRRRGRRAAAGSPRKDAAAAATGGLPARANGRPASREEAMEALLAAGAGTLVGRILGLWTPQRQPGVLGLARAAAAGAGAAFLRKLVRPLLHGELRPLEVDEALVDALMAGAARGLLYASVVEPRLPGPSLTRGLLYGAAEYAVSPWGGLTGLVGSHAPHRRFPFLAGLFEEYADEEDTLVDHLAFAAALSLLYGRAGGDSEPVGTGSSESSTSSTKVGGASLR